jgi:hypothetical protein
MRTSSQPLLRWSCPVFIVFCIGGLAQAQFAPNQLAVLRVGDGSGGLGNASTAVFIDQFTPQGAPGGPMVTIPISGNPVTLSGSATSEGFMSLSLDGRYLVFGGYNTAPGLASVATTDATATPRTVVRIDNSGTVQMSNLPNSFNGSNIRSAASTNGSDIWVAGNGGSGQGATAGLRYHVFGSGAVTQLSNTSTNRRVVTIANNQLYLTSATGTPTGLHGVSTYGPGLHTTSGQTLTLLPGFPNAAGPSPYGLFGLDNPQNPFAGIDTFYVADDRAAASGGGLQRWVFDGTTWTLSATINPGTGLRGLTGGVTGSTVTLYGTTTEGSANRLVSITDVLSPTGGTFDAAGFATLAMAPANTAFRGVAFTPVPEPTHLLLAGGAAAGLVGWRRRRKIEATDRG